MKRNLIKLTLKKCKSKNIYIKIQNHFLKEFNELQERQTDKKIKLRKQHMNKISLITKKQHHHQ